MRLRELCAVMIVVWLLLMVGCSATGQRFEYKEPGSNKSVVYIYRASRVFGSGNVFAIYINGKAVTRLSNGGYHDFRTGPQNLQFHVQRNTGPLLPVVLDNAALKDDIKLEFEAKAGQSYFVEFSQGFGSVSLQLVNQEEALETLHSLRRCESIEPRSD